LASRGLFEKYLLLGCDANVDLFVASRFFGGRRRGISALQYVRRRHQQRFSDRCGALFKSATVSENIWELQPARQVTHLRLGAEEEAILTADLPSTTQNLALERMVNSTRGRLACG